ncbi:SNF2 family N-terminal domain-containing protein [Chytriomyces sp. MP71]|nr:SNF2 family N-terminal domain-containing protein [Chytriomyces sp. MP71]
MSGLKRPLFATTAQALAPAPTQTTSSAQSRVFSVLVRKKQSFTKKHKSWDDDALCVVGTETGSAVLISSDGREIAKHSKFILSNDPLDETIYAFGGGREIQISCEIAWETYASGSKYMPFSKSWCAWYLTRITECFLGGNKQLPLVAAPGASSASVSHSIVRARSTNVLGGKFKAPSFVGKGSAPMTTVQIVKPRHDPEGDGAIVLMRPVLAKGDKRQIVDVVVDPFLAVNLRPHQVEGVHFLYECVMGMKDFDGCGAILADEMGLGKTLQAISLIWTLLKQSAIANAPPPVKRALIVCPATLCLNWKREFNKWLGEERIRVFVLADKGDIANFTVGKVYSVLICGYEKLRLVKDALNTTAFDIVVADEGHRLKNAATQASQILAGLKTRRRVILSGTPIQNDLGEFHAMCDLVNPGVLGSRDVFYRVYEDPILKGREKGAATVDVDLGSQRAFELSRITQAFILRRTSAIFAQGGRSLPPKTEVTLFIRLGAVQERVYEHVVAHPLVRRVYGSGDGRNVLGYITLLKKLVNSAALVHNEDTGSAVELGLSKFMKEEFDVVGLSVFELSSKIRVLSEMLTRIKETTCEKVVIISNWTQTLDVVQGLLQSKNMTFLRLDGQTDSSKRQNLVDQFNRTPASTFFCFLLSAKAGGLGLNLIGASRLFLLDIDWNPSICLQAMARVWREGQKMPVKIYRFLTTGSIEERIFQRQISKMGLSDALMDQAGEGAGATKFSKEELRDLFTFSKDVECLSMQIPDDEVRERVMNGFSAFSFGQSARDESLERISALDSVLGDTFRVAGVIQGLVSFCLVKR